MSEGKANYTNNEDYNKPFPTMLRKLIDDKHIATQSEVAKYAKVTRQSISSYQNGTSVPSITVFEKIVEFFNVQKNLNYSTDYWLGLATEPYKDLEVKYIYEKYGLDENSQKNLEHLNLNENFADVVNKKPNKSSTIQTINILLSELKEAPRDIALIDYINSYINFNINKDYVIAIKENGDIEVFDKKDKKKHKSHIIIPAEAQIEVLIKKIEQKLANMRNVKQEQIKGEDKNINYKKRKRLWL